MKLGEEVAKGDPLAICHGNSEKAVSQAYPQIKSAIEIGVDPFTPEEVII